MKFKETFRGTAALLCILQVCLLSLASMFPEVHDWVFHGGTSSGTECIKATCHDPHHKNESKQSDQEGHHDTSCPVCLLTQGVAGLESEPFLLEAPITHFEFTSSETGIERIVRRDDSIRARAPPQSS